ncbi:GFA family protein [Hyphococcus sp.]|uniref:GFA family protein n=1 Tax=Hyphococcus sp. TaxID=2038636 RepID=UPI0035C66204
MKIIKMDVTGGCQCGAVRYRTDRMLDNSHLCHCRMCQKAMGNIFAALVATPNEALQWTRGEPAVFQSSDYAERGFCADCGTPLFFNSLDNDRINLTIGSLDHPDQFPPHNQMGTSSRIAWFVDIATLKVTDFPEEPAMNSANRQHPDHETESWPPKQP